MNIQAELDKAFTRYGRLGTREIGKLSEDLDMSIHRIVLLLQAREKQGAIKYRSRGWEVTDEA